MHPPPPADKKQRKLAQHDLHFERAASVGESPKVSVTCEGRACEVSLEDCATCPRFVRIDVHEAGYLLRCRDTLSDDDALPVDDSER